MNHADDSAGWTFSRAIPILDEKGEIIEWVGAVSDMSERKEAEKKLHVAMNDLEHKAAQKERTLRSRIGSVLRPVRVASIIYL